MTIFRPVYSKDVRKDFRSMGSQDTRTFVTYTVKFYYTQENDSQFISNIYLNHKAEEEDLFKSVV